MKEVERTGKTVDEAVLDALRELNVTRDKVEVTVLEEPVKGFLGIGSKLAKVSVKVKHDPVAVASAFLREMCTAMGLVVKVDCELTDKQLNITLSGEDMGVLIGKRGQTLDSIQYLTNLAVNKGDAPYLAIVVDTENYRERRKETLEKLAFNLAKKAKQTRRSVRLEPMNPYERRIIHSALQNDKQIATHSEGEEPFRNIVITLKTGRN